jgi:3D (Asp-Asp-Asp) domain-containing protein
MMDTKLTEPPSIFGGRAIYCLVLFALIYAFLFPQYSWAYFFGQENAATDDPPSSYAVDQLLGIGSTQNIGGRLITIGGNTLIQTSDPLMPFKTEPSCFSQSRFAIITAYSSSPDETDSSPFITAAGTRTRDGIIAANFLKFGTKVKIPALYGDKIFVVEDRMASYNNGKVDIWMSSKSQALQFGVRRAEIIVLN